nr:MAG TPA: internal head protein [Bacteriophage sp.]
MNDSYVFNALDDAIVVEEMAVLIVNEVNNASTALMVINKQQSKSDNDATATDNKRDDKSSDGEKKSPVVKEGILRKFLDKLKTIFRKIKEFVAKYFRKIKEFVHKYYSKLRDKLEKKEAIIAGAKKLPDDIKFRVFGGKSAFLADKIYLKDTADVIDYHIQDFVKIAEGNATGVNINGHNTDKVLDDLMNNFKTKSEDAHTKLTTIIDVGTDAEYTKADVVENIEKIIKFSREFKLSDADKFEREIERKADKAVNELVKLRGKVLVDTKLVTAMNMVMNANQKLLSKLLDAQGKIIRNQVFVAKSIINACLNAESLKTGNTTAQ